MTWTTTRLKHLAAAPIVNGLGEAATLGDDTWPRYIRTTDFAGPRALRESTRATLPPEVAAKAPIRKGDLLLSAAGTVGKTYLHLFEEPACFAGYLVRFTPQPSVDPRFIAYWTETPLFLDQVETGKVRSTIDNFSAGKYQNLRLKVPASEAQRAIADFLDTETARIDALITKKRRMINLLRGRQDALRSRVLWSGNPATISLHHLTPPSRQIMYGIVLPGPDVDEGVTIIKGGDVASSLSRPLCRTTHEIEHAYRRSRVGTHDVVFAIRGGVGDVALVAPEVSGSNITQDVARISPRDGVEPRWLFHVLKSPEVQSDARALTTGATIRGLNIRDLKLLRVPHVPQAVQRAQASELDGEERKIHELTSRLRRQVDLLQEHRQALITAAVSGDLDVPGVAA